MYLGHNHLNQGLITRSIDDATRDDEIKIALRIDSDAVRGHLDELVRSTVEEP